MPPPELLPPLVDAGAASPSVDPARWRKGHRIRPSRPAGRAKGGATAWCSKCCCATAGRRPSSRRGVASPVGQASSRRLAISPAWRASRGRCDVSGGRTSRGGGVGMEQT
ncbi:hypothetical protein PR202_gb10053 [Eleusine coracana subsp. coracana]|uniref:Uncharacterized protein n=1 Tax=Eleusine coracana subsp. coracana TaxID=191504 RepID=A0AAV5EIA6_ELECO|nr:hypothetical protein PR202_gb10053 [Eleusine coracana subsp. coracana]